MRSMEALPLVPRRSDRRPTHASAVPCRAEVTVASPRYSVERWMSSSLGLKPCSWAMRRFSFNSVMNGIASTPILL
jgi:hypothetical protein